MPVHHPGAVRAGAVALAAALLPACGSSAAAPPPATVPPAPDPVVEAAGDPVPEPAPSSGAHAVSLVADLGPLPDGSGRAVVDTTWTVDAHGTRHLRIDTPAGIAEQHVMTEDEHWWWLAPEVRKRIVDAEWIHFDLQAIADAGGELPDVVVSAREAVRQPGEVGAGHVIAGREVLAADAVDDDEVHLTLAGIDRPVVHRRRALPPDTKVDLPVGAVDVRDVPDVLRW